MLQQIMAIKIPRVSPGTKQSTDLGKYFVKYVRMNHTLSLPYHRQFQMIQSTKEYLRPLWSQEMQFKYDLEQAT